MSQQLTIAARLFVKVSVLTQVLRLCGSAVFPICHPYLRLQPSTQSFLNIFIKTAYVGYKRLGVISSLTSRFPSYHTSPRHVSFLLAVFNSVKILFIYTLSTNSHKNLSPSKAQFSLRGRRFDNVSRQ